MTHLPSDLPAVNEEGNGANDDGTFGFNVAGNTDSFSASSSRRHPNSNSPTRTFFSRLSKRNNNRGIQEALSTSSATNATETPASTLAPNVTNSDSALNESYATRMRTRSQRGSTLPNTTPTTSTGPAALRRGIKGSKNEELKLKSTEDKITLPLLDTNRKDEYSPLFYKVSKHGFCTPNPGNNTPLRLNAFRNVGRYIFIFIELYLKI